MARVPSFKLSILESETLNSVLQRFALDIVISNSTLPSPDITRGTYKQRNLISPRKTSPHNIHKITHN